MRTMRTTHCRRTRIYLAVPTVLRAVHFTDLPALREAQENAAAARIQAQCRAARDDGLDPNWDFISK